MARLLTILVLAGLLAGMLPPATCRGMDSCCCAQGQASGKTALAAAPDAAGSCPAHARQASARPASTLARRCPCTPEMRGCAPERDPGTQPASALQVIPAVAPLVASPIATLALLPVSHTPPAAESPPPISPPALHTILRI